MTEHTLPKRKPNRLPTPDYSQEGAYFITICTKDRRHILSSIVGDGASDVPRVILTPLGNTVHTQILKTAEKSGIIIEHLVIMPNHIHLLLRVNEDGTSRAPSPTNKNCRTNARVPHFVSTLKRFVQKEFKFQIFQRSFHDHVVRDRHDYRKIAAYIANNPQTWREDCFFSE